MASLPLSLKNQHTDTHAHTYTNIHAEINAHSIPHQIGTDNIMHFAFIVHSQLTGNMLRKWDVMSTDRPTFLHLRWFHTYFGSLSHYPITNPPKKALVNRRNWSIHWFCQTASFALNKTKLILLTDSDSCCAPLCMRTLFISSGGYKVFKSEQAVAIIVKSKPNSQLHFICGK